jgi:hypothetical protein
MLKEGYYIRRTTFSEEIKQVIEKKTDLRRK